MNFEPWVDLHIRHYRKVLGLSFVIAIFSSLFALSYIRFDFDLLGMLPRDDPTFGNFRTFVEDFGELDELVILLEGEQPDELATYGRRLASRVAALESVDELHFEVDEDVLHRGVFGKFLFHLMPVKEIDSLGSRLSRQGIEKRLKGLKRQLANPIAFGGSLMLQRDPLGLTPIAARHLNESLEISAFQGRNGMLSSPDGRALLLLVRPKGNAFDGEFTHTFLSDVLAIDRDLRSELDDPTSITFSHTGSYSFAEEDAATIRRDIERYLLLALLGVLAVFFIGYRSLRVLPFVAWPLLLNAVVTLALSRVFFSELNAMSLSFTAILYGLSIDSAIHFYTRLSQQRLQNDLRRALITTIDALWVPSLVAAATTAGLFLLIATTFLSGIRQMALLTACGMITNALLFFLLYPSLAYAVNSEKAQLYDLAMPGFGRFCERIASSTTVLGCSLLAGTILSVYLASQLFLDTDLQKLRPQNSTAFDTQQRVAGYFGDPKANTAVMIETESLEDGLRRS